MRYVVVGIACAALLSACAEPPAAPCWDTVKVAGSDCSRDVCVYVINPCGKQLVRVDSVVIGS
jgi:hypothetical protein